MGVDRKLAHQGGPLSSSAQDESPEDPSSRLVFSFTLSRDPSVQRQSPVDEVVPEPLPEVLDRDELLDASEGLGGASDGRRV